MVDAKLECIYAQIPASTCPPHCGKCCGILYPSLAELRNIKNWCESRHVEYKDPTMTVGLDCPYLTEQKECSIYPVRPFLCRILGVSSDLPCPLGKCNTHKELNQPQSRALYAAIYLKGKEKPRTEKHRKLVKQMLKTARKG
jgi:hypothetical protein